jgi:uncharacterized protein YjbJ (UPF0337 family)
MGKSTEELKRDIEHTRQDLGGTLDAIGDRVSPKQIVRRRTERARRALTSVRESVMGSADSARDGTQKIAGQAGEVAGNVTQSVADTARNAPEAVVRQTRGNPLAAGLVAFGVGLVVASLIPPSKPEQQAAGAIQDTLEPLKDRALEAAHEVTDEVKSASADAAQGVKDTAVQATGELRDQAKSSAAQVKDDAAAATQRD